MFDQNQNQDQSQDQNPGVDYDALIKQYGGSTSPAASAQPTPATQAAQPAATSGVDYDALIKQYGGSTSAPAPAAPATQPGAVSRFASGAWSEAKNLVTGPVTAAGQAIKALVAPPQDARESAVHAVGGDSGLVAYRAANQVVGSAENLFKAKRETFRQAQADFAKGVQDLHNGNWRQGLSDAASTGADLMSLSPATPPGVGERVRELSEGARPGGDLATPLGKTVTDLGAAYVAEKAPEAAVDVAQLAKEKLSGAHAYIKDAFVQPEAPTPTQKTPKPVAAHVSVDTPFDNAAIRKLGGGELKPEAVDVIQQHAGDTIPAGSSPQNHLMRAVAPINKTISEQGLALNKVLEDAGNLSVSPKANVDSALEEFKKNLPGGTEEQFGKAIDKERARVEDALDSTDPLEINSVKRDLDKRIKDYTKPEKPMNTPADAAEAARVIMRRSLSDTLSQEIPATKPINQELSKNLEARGFLADKLKDVAYDPVEADAQHTSEFQKGKTIVDNEAKDAAAKADYDAKVAKVKSNLLKLRVGTGAVGLAYFHNQIGKLLELL